MVTATKLRMHDLPRQKQVEVELSETGELTPSHTVGAAVDYFKNRLNARDSTVRYTAFSRGVTLDHKQRLSDVPVADSEWTIVPSVSAG